MSADQSALPPEVAAALSQLDDLIQMFARHPDEGVQDAVVGVLRAVDVVHRGALQRLAAWLDARSLLDDAMADPHVELLFGLYRSLEHGEDEQARAEAAVEEIRPYVEAHGGQLEVVAADGGVVSIRLLGACDGCSGSTATLRGLVEEALRAELPEFVRMDVSSPERGSARPTNPQPVLIPVSSVTVRSRAPSPQGGSGSAAHGCSSGG
ncbi:MAG: NifU family protein [Actinomycetota bacterium]|nr:NifU family protein [Actinomycetota bacterium]